MLCPLFGHSRSVAYTEDIGSHRQILSLHPDIYLKEKKNET